MRPERCLRLGWLCALLLPATLTSAQDAPESGWTWQSGALGVEAALETYSAGYAMQGTWWNLAAVSAPDFDPDRNFAELWVHPKLAATYALHEDAEFYGALSVGVTQTIGGDPFDYEDEGTARMGSAVLGLRGAGAGWKYDVSFGRQPYTLGTGMLLTAGSSNGYSWGGGASAQRKVWGLSALASLGRGEFTATAFLLEPDEPPEAYTDTRVEGVALEWQRAQVGKAGLAWINVPRSNAVYPGDLAPLDFIDDGRDGLETWHGWLNVTGLVPGIPTLGLRGEFARQRSDVTRASGQRDPMEAEAWLLGASWQAQRLPWAPKLSYHYARFSGDNPDTDVYERFDPLYWGNGLDNWWFGANGAYSWLNANLRAHRFIVDVYVTPRDILQAQYVAASVDQTNSAVQFGQGAQITARGLVVGVPQSELSDEYYLQYSRVFTAKLIATAFVSYSVPGAGIEATLTQQSSDNWMTIGLGLTANF